MDLRNKIVELYIVNNLGFDYANLEATLGEMADNCVNKYCPMGMFSCPINRKHRCEDVTVDMWAEVFHLCEDNDV